MVYMEFRASCPHGIGDKIIVRKTDPMCRIPYLSTQDEVHTITNIMCVHSVKDGSVQFLFDLDNSGKLACYMRIGHAECLCELDGSGRFAYILPVGGMTK